jgi:heterodisulfide reductase subunit A-like polyferredoxin
MRALRILAFIGVGSVSVGSAFAIDQSRSSDDLDNFPLKDTIVRDVCIIGGGSTGTFSAIRFRDRGESVVVIERKDRLGGHTETYQDSITGLTTEAGVVAWVNFTVVTNISPALIFRWSQSGNPSQIH